MTATQVFVVTAVVVLMSIGLVVSGVATLLGTGWALVAAGTLLGASATVGAWLLLREGRGS